MTAAKVYDLYNSCPSAMDNFGTYLAKYGQARRDEEAALRAMKSKVEVYSLCS